MSRFVTIIALVAMIAFVFVAASPSMDDIETDLTLLEAEADASPSASSVLADAQSYASSKLAAANEVSKNLLAKAAAEGRSEAKELGPSPKAIAQKSALAKAEAAQVALKAKAAKGLAAATAAKAAAVKAVKQAVRRKRLAQAKLGFGTQGLKHDKQGVFGGVTLGISKIDAIPSNKSLKQSRRDRRSALHRVNKFAKKTNIYGRKKSCLKDIAAHFDEKDIYESKKLSLLQRMEHAKSRSHAIQLRSKLSNLESWHQMMQQKFMRSQKEEQAMAAKEQRLFDAHLPQDLLDQLKANKVAKRAAQKIPFPNAHSQALKILRSKRAEIERGDRLVAAGGKRMIRPSITNREFPSMDPISSHLREKLWRNVFTENKWSTDKGQMELAEGVVTKAHKAHGDFIEGPIAAPLLKGKLYHPDTEALGVPDFLTNFPWPKKREEKVTMDDKVKVEQSYHQTW